MVGRLLSLPLALVLSFAWLPGTPCAETLFFDDNLNLRRLFRLAGRTR